MHSVKSKNRWRAIESYAINTLGLLLTALGWTAFLIPAQITAGGVSGAGALVFYATGVPIGLTYLGVNVILVALAVKILGKSFGVRTVFGVLGLSFFLSLLQSLIKEPIVDDTFMACIIGGILSGTGVGLTFSQGGSTGGTDIIAMIINKYRNTSPGRVMMFIDIFIISSSWFLFRSIEKMVYGYVTMAVSTYVIDLVLTGSRASYQIMIFTPKYVEIADRIMLEVDRGVTVIDGKGWYTKQDVNCVLVLCRKSESSIIFRICKEIDPDAFISFASVMGVYGKGFDRIKI